MTKEKTITSFD